MFAFVGDGRTSRPDGPARRQTAASDITHI